MKFGKGCCNMRLYVASRITIYKTVLSFLFPVVMPDDACNNGLCYEKSFSGLKR